MVDERVFWVLGSPSVNALGVKFVSVKLCNFRRILLSFYIELPKVSESDFDVLEPLILLAFLCRTGRK